MPSAETLSFSLTSTTRNPDWTPLLNIWEIGAGETFHCSLEES